MSCPHGSDWPVRPPTPLPTSGHWLFSFPNDTKAHGGVNSYVKILTVGLRSANELATGQDQNCTFLVKEFNFSKGQMIALGIDRAIINMFWLPMLKDWIVSKTFKFTDYIKYYGLEQHPFAWTSICTSCMHSHRLSVGFHSEDMTDTLHAHMVAEI